MQQQRIKLYIVREVQAKNDIDKLYCIIAGQCSQSELSVPQNNEEYEEKDDKCHMFWFIGKMQEITSGLDSKSDKRSNLHVALLNVTKMQQYKEETDDDHMKCFKENIDTLNAAGGSHVLCSKEIMEIKLPLSLTKAEKATEIEKFKATIFHVQTHHFA